MRISLTAGLACGFLCASAFGESATPSDEKRPASAKGPDESIVSPLSETEITLGLTRLAVMLEPDLPANAAWVRMRPETHEVGLLLLEGDGGDIRGNGFLVREKAGSEAEVWMPVIAGNVQVHRQQMTRARYMQDEYVLSATTGTWEAADLLHDVAEVKAMLRKQFERVKKASASRSEAPDFSSQVPGMAGSNEPRFVYRVMRQSALLWAGALQRTGHSTEAANIAALALEGTTAEDRKGLLDQIFQFQADACWRRAFASFDESHDWKQLHDQLESIVQRFSLGWPRRDAARVFVRKLEERIAQGQTPPLKLSSPVSEPDQKILREWLETPDAASHHWSLLSPVAEEDDETPKPPNDAKEGFPTSRGVSAVPLLVALLKDDTLTQNKMGDVSPYFSEPDQGDPLERLKHGYRQLLKLPTRGEVAWKVLLSVLPSSMRQGDQEDFDDKGAEVMAWYATIKDASAADIALSYLESGDSSPDVIAHVLKTKDEKKIRRVEDALINTAQLYSLEQFLPYVQERGEKAGSFVKKLRDKFQAEIERYEGGNAASQQKQLDLAMKRFEAAAGGQVNVRSADELFAILEKKTADSEMPEGDDERSDQIDVSEALKDLPLAMAKLAGPEKLSLLMKHLPKMNSGRIIYGLYYAMFDPRYRNRGSGGSLYIQLSPEQRKQALAETHDAWVQLLRAEIPDVADDEEQRMSFMVGTAMAIECLVTGKTIGDFGNSIEPLVPLGKRLQSIVRKRAEAYLNGQSPEALPEIKDIPAAELKKLLSDWGTLSPGDLQQRIAALSPSEYVAVVKELAVADQWPEAVTKIGCQVAQVSAGDRPNERWQSWQGRTVDFEALAALAQQVAAQEGGDPVLVSLSFISPLEGWAIRVRTGAQAKRSAFERQVESLKRQIANTPEPLLSKHGSRICTAWFLTPSLRLQWGWFDIPKTASPPVEKTGRGPFDEADPVKDLTENEGSSWEQIRGFLADHGQRPADQSSFHVFSASCKSLDEGFKAAPRTGP